jgi:ketosteroid isomerase-like protein
MPTREERQLDIIKALYEASGAGDWTTAASYLTDDFYATEANTLPFAGTYRGRNGLQELFTKVMGMMDVSGFDIKARTAGDDHVVVILDIILADAAQTRIPIAEMFRFRGDKVCEIRPFYFDPTPVVAAVRARPAAKAS